MLSILVFNVMIKAYGIGKCYSLVAWRNLVLLQTNVATVLSYTFSPVLTNHTFQSSSEENAGSVSDCVRYSSMVSSFAKLGQLKITESLYKEMTGYAVQPDVIIYSVLISAFADAGSIKKVVSYAYEMRKAGLPWNSAIYNSLMKLYTKVGYLKEAQETYMLLQSSDQGPSVFSSNCMIDLFTERLMVEQANEIFESLKNNNIANEFSYAMMLCMYKKIGRLEEATEIAKQMRKLGLTTDLLSYNNVLGLYSMDRRLHEARHTFKEMIVSRIQPDDITFRALGHVYCILVFLSRQLAGLR